jgi:hypothetical protein
MRRRARAAPRCGPRGWGRARNTARTPSAKGGSARGVGWAHTHHALPCISASMHACATRRLAFMHACMRMRTRRVDDHLDARAAGDVLAPRQRRRCRGVHHVARRRLQRLHDGVDVARVRERLVALDVDDDVKCVSAAERRGRLGAALRAVAARGGRLPRAGGRVGTQQRHTHARIYAGQARVSSTSGSRSAALRAMRHAAGKCSQRMCCSERDALRAMMTSAPKPRHTSRMRASSVATTAAAAGQQRGRRRRRRACERNGEAAAPKQRRLTAVRARRVHAPSRLSVSAWRACSHVCCAGGRAPAADARNVSGFLPLARLHTSRARRARNLYHGLVRDEHQRLAREARRGVARRNDAQLRGERRRRENESSTRVRQPRMCSRQARSAAQRTCSTRGTCCVRRVAAAAAAHVRPHHAAASLALLAHLEVRVAQ